MYIDVPNGEKIYLKNKYYDVVLEHINYWSVWALAKVLTSAGYEILRIGEVLEGNHIAAIALKQDRGFTFINKINKDKMLLNKMIENNKCVSIWGAGVKGSVFCRFIEQAGKIKYLFDIDRNLEGLYLEGFDVPITYPTKEAIFENDMIIISAVEHKIAIMDMLKEHYKYHGYVICIDEF